MPNNSCGKENKMAKNNFKFMILQETINQGLGPIASYIEKSVKRKIYILDYLGHICHPFDPEYYNTISKKPTGFPLNCNFMEIPQQQIRDGGYFFQEETQYFCYAQGTDNTRAYVIIENLPANLLPRALAAIEDVQFALKYYFLALKKILEHTRVFERKIIDYFFKKGSLELTPFFKFCNTDLDQNRRYYVSLMHIIEIGGKISHEMINSYSQRYFNKIHRLMISIVGDNDIIFIIPEVNAEDSLEPDKGWPEFDPCKLNEELESKFDVMISTGVGGIYNLENLDKSYQEARIALTIPRLMGKTRFVQKFSDLGVFALIFTDIDSYKEFSLQYLGKLIEYDQKNGTDFMGTLQMLINNNFNFKLTAENLFIHVNTLHYRVIKISEILQVDFTDMQNKNNIYASVIVYNTLKVNNWL